jgi:hypothetical protein
VPTENSTSNGPPEEVGWSHEAQDAAEAEEAARIGGVPAPAPEAMRQSLPLGRFLLLLVVVCIAFALIIYFIWGR